MDIELERNINDAIEYLKKFSDDIPNFNLMDPIAKMMLVSLLHETQKVKDYVDGVGDKIIERYCENFIPRREIEAMPAIAVVEAKFKPKKDTETINVGTGATLNYKLGDSKQQINYVPLFNTLMIPNNDIIVLTQNSLKIGDNSYDVSIDCSNCLWLGIETKAEIETLKGLSVLINGADGIIPEHIYVGTGNYELGFADMTKLEDIELTEPFDAQQSSGKFFSMIENWKDAILNVPDKSLFYITDSVTDRDLFKPRVLSDSIKVNAVWLRMEFPKDYVVPSSCTAAINVLPVVNVEVESVTLTQNSPIAKLQKQENSYFLQVIETSTTAYKQGFNMTGEDIIIRDFDASAYHDGNLYRDVRNIYNHFIDDYYAFIEYNGIKDGETITQLRSLINRIGKGVGTSNSRYSFDSGTYVMKNMNQYPQTSSVKVSFATTLGKMGNAPKMNETMENKKLPSIEKDLRVIIPGLGGTDKANVDDKYELLRYYSLTNDRLYTKKDVEAFLRKEIIAEFGKEEFKRIFIKMHIEGTAGERKLQRGLYISIEFKDKKNYEKAVDSSFKQRMCHKIKAHSCISMPIILELINFEVF